MPDQYRVGELLGRGGMGQVHMARHRAGHLVAIKRVRNTLAHDPIVTARLIDEAKMLQRVAHPNVVRALATGMGADGQPYLVMDRAHGTSLATLIANQGPLPAHRIATIVAQLLAGLAAIHDAGIAHADMKSSNVVVDDCDQVTIIDFGLARQISASNDNGMIAGTPAYMAPEVLDGAVPSIAADIYAAGTIIYEMLTGTTQFRGEVETLIVKLATEEPVPPSRRAPRRGISRDVDAIVLRAIHRRADHRHASARDLAAEIATAYHSESSVGATLDLLDVVATRDFWNRATISQLASPRAQPTDSTETVITGALAGVREVIASKDFLAAAEMLESTLRSLAPDLESGDLIPAAAWRVETVLAALYESVGRNQAACRVARVAYQHALRSGCEHARAQTRAFLDRILGVRTPQFARGSRQIVVTNR